MDSSFFSSFSNTKSGTLQPEAINPPGLLEPRPSFSNSGYYPYNAPGTLPARNTPHALYASNDYWNSPSSAIDSFASYSQPFNPAPSYPYPPEYPSEYSSHSLMELSSPSFFSPDTATTIPSRQEDSSNHSFTSREDSSMDPPNSFMRSQTLSSQLPQSISFSSTVPAPVFLPPKSTPFSPSPMQMDKPEPVSHPTPAMRNYSTVREFVPSKSNSLANSSTELTQEPATEPLSSHDPVASRRKTLNSSDHPSGMNGVGPKKGRKPNGRVGEEDDADG